jgi:hypothetical protein
VERLARTLKTIAAKMTPQDLTAQALIQAIHEYNRTPHSALGTTPFTAFFGIQPQLPLDQKYGTSPPSPPSQATIQATQTAFAHSWANRLNQRRPQFQVGDRVLHYPATATTQAHAAGRHLRRRAFGPFTVLAHRRFNRLLVTDSSHHFILPAGRLRLFYPNNQLLKGGESKG